MYTFNLMLLSQFVCVSLFYFIILVYNKYTLYEAYLVASSVIKFPLITGKSIVLQKLITVNHF